MKRVILTLGIVASVFVFASCDTSENIEEINVEALSIDDEDEYSVFSIDDEDEYGQSQANIDDEDEYGS